MASSGGKALLPEVQPHNRRLSLAVCLFLAASVWAVFGQTLHHDFVNYDDDRYVSANPIVSRGLNWKGIVWVFTHSHAANWHPLTSLTHMLDCQLYGLHPGGHHLTNVLLHGATAILLFLILQNMTGALWRSAFVAAVFAVHPLHVESVAWVAERKDVLSGMFFVLTLGAYVRYVQKQSKVESRESSTQATPAPCSRLWSLDYWLVVVCFALGLMSKPMLVTLPLVLLLLDYWPLNRLPSPVSGAPHAQGPAWFGLFVEKIPFLLLSAAACVTTVLAQRTSVQSFQTIDLPSRIRNALVSYVDYLWQMLYPVKLAVFYPYPRHLPVWMVGLSLLILILISTGVVAGRRKRPWMLVGWLWYLGMLAPVIGLVQVGAQARADRYTYLPQIGLYVLAAWGVVELCGAWRHRQAVLGMGAAAIFAVLLADAHIQTGYWQNSESLWRHALACASENPLAHNNLGNALVARGQLAEAIEHYERALRLEPDYAQGHNNLAIALARQGKLVEAISHLEQALQLKPDYAEAHFNLGIALAVQGKPAEALLHYQQALTLATARGNAALAEAIRARLESGLPALPRTQTPY